jgi:hypothetical protein
MNELEMTDKQIDELTSDCYGRNITQGHDVARAAQQKLITWLFEICDTQDHYGVGIWPRADCPQCRRELKKELEL